MDIKEAVEIVNKLLVNRQHTVKCDCEECCGLQTLISLAEKVESIKGLPEKKELLKFNAKGDLLRKGYNQAIDDCKLYIAKMLDEGRIEEIIEREMHLWQCEPPGQVLPITQIAKAIVKELGGE